MVEYRDGRLLSSKPLFFTYSVTELQSKQLETFSLFKYLKNIYSCYINLAKF
jgi:hypothetical protein